MDEFSLPQSRFAPLESERTAGGETGDVSPPRGNGFPVVGIGASAGGLDAFKELLAALPAGTGMAFVLIQHLDPTYESHLSDILQTGTPLPVITVTDGLRMERDKIYIIPPNTSMELRDGQLHLAPRERGLHLPIDIFFLSLAKAQGSRAIGIVLSGNASDGSQGLRAIKAECGITFAQDEASARFGGMPRSAVATGAVDYVMPPAEIARELTRLGQHPYLISEAPDRHDAEVLPEGEADLRKLFGIIQNATKVDFFPYKRTTIRRRIGRRMMVHKLLKLSDYVRYLEEHRGEVRELYRDLLITVTSFFREPETFEALTRLVKERMLERKPRADQAVRVWVPGCSTGEEVYSIAISLYELLQEIRLGSPLQIFGTDISEVALERARSGVYPEIVTHEVSPERLNRFFLKVDGGFQISKAIRESCVFARQDLARDPPFSHMDVISCRNVLIYMGTQLQRRVLPIFHYSLNQDGLLMLGSAESTFLAEDLFTVRDKTAHIYGRKPVSVRMTLDLSLGRPSTPVDSGNSGAREAATDLDMQKKVERVIQSRYSPDGVLVDSDLRILQFRGRTSAYLEPGPGEPSLNLLRMARESLMLPLRRALQNAREKGTPVRESGVLLDDAAGRREVVIEVTPIAGASAAETHYLVVFETLDRPIEKAPLPEAPMPPGDEAESFIRQLQRELAETRDYLRNLSEDYEAHAEELRAANEEIRSANEELRSANEELGTTKEELQSANEELTTVNEELQNRNHELGSLNNDLKNLLGAVQIPIVMVDNDLRLRRFTTAAEKLLNLGPVDLGRPVGHLRGKIQINEIESLIHSVLEKLNVDRREVQDDEGRWHSVVIRPYRTLDNRIDGAVIAFFDIDPLKRALRSAEEARDYAEGMIETVREPLLVLDADLRVQRATTAFHDMFQVSREETVGRFFYDLGSGQWNNPRLRELIGNALFRNETFADFEITGNFPNIGLRNMRLNGRRIPIPEDHSRIVLLAIEDITQRREEAEMRYLRLFEAAKDAIIVVDPETSTVTDVNPFTRELTGYSREDLVSRKVEQLALFSACGISSTLVDDTMKQGTVRASAVPLVHASGRSVWVDIVASRYEIGSRPVLQMNIRNVTEQRQSAAALKYSEDRFRLFVESVKDYALFQLDVDGRVVTWNAGAARVLGYSDSEIIGHSARLFFTPEDLATGEAEKEMTRAREEGRSEDERWHLRKDGSRFFASGIVSPIRDDSGRLRGYSKLMRDVTERKTADERLRASLHEKEVLLREVHHRVKNNLQVVASLLNLQSEHLQDPQAAAALDEMRTRIQSIASIHELLYGAADLSHIEFDRYLNQLAQDLSSFYSVESNRLRIQVSADPLNLSIGQAVPCALIVNELLTNSIKHAFPKNGALGLIHVRALIEAGDSMLIEVEDNGTGLPEDIDLANPETMGLQLVTTLAEQLQAKLSVERENGTRFRVRFPLKNGS